MGTRGPRPSFKTFPLKAVPELVHDPALEMTLGQFCESSRFWGWMEFKLREGIVVLDQSCSIEI